MRRLKRLTVSREFQSLLADHLGPEFHREKQVARRSSTVRHVVVLVALAALAAMSLVLFHR